MTRCILLIVLLGMGLEGWSVTAFEFTASLFGYCLRVNAGKRAWFVLYYNLITRYMSICRLVGFEEGSGNFSNCLFGYVQECNMILKSGVRCSISDFEAENKI